MSLNKSFYGGFLGADPEVRNTAGGRQVANARVASTRKWKDNEGNEQKETCWLDLEAWGGWADAIGRFAKGELLLVEGRLRLDEWNDKESGAKRSKIKLFVEQVLNPKPRPQDGGGGGEGGYEDAAPARAPQGQRQAPAQRQAPPQRQTPAQPEMFTADL